MGTPLGPKYIPYTYIDPLGYSSTMDTTQLVFKLGFVPRGLDPYAVEYSP